MKNYLKYSGLALQMGAAIAVMAYLGVYLDKRFETTQPWFTIVACLVAIIGSIVKLIIDLKQDEDSD